MVLAFPSNEKLRSPFAGIVARLLKPRAQSRSPMHHCVSTGYEQTLRNTAPIALITCRRLKSRLAIASRHFVASLAGLCASSTLVGRSAVGRAGALTNAMPRACSTNLAPQASTASPTVLVLCLAHLFNVSGSSFSHREYWPSQYLRLYPPSGKPWLDSAWSRWSSAAHAASNAGCGAGCALTASPKKTAATAAVAAINGRDVPMRFPPCSERRQYWHDATVANESTRSKGYTMITIRQGNWQVMAYCRNTRTSTAATPASSTMICNSIFQFFALRTSIRKIAAVRITRVSCHHPRLPLAARRNRLTHAPPDPVQQNPAACCASSAVTVRASPRWRSTLGCRESLPPSPQFFDD